jgi:hypothetical protein
MDTIDRGGRTKIIARGARIIEGSMPACSLRPAQTLIPTTRFSEESALRTGPRYNMFGNTHLGPDHQAIVLNSELLDVQFGDASVFKFFRFVLQEARSTLVRVKARERGLRHLTVIPEGVIVGPGANQHAFLSVATSDPR